MRLILSLILLSCFQTLSSQEYITKNYTVEDGLPSSECYQVTQDDKGYIWIATDNGACRFDGSNFKTFGIKDGLADQTVFRVFSFQGTVHFRTISGTIYSLIGDTIVELPIFKKLKKELEIKNRALGELVVDSSDILHIGVETDSNDIGGYYVLSSLDDFYFNSKGNNDKHIIVELNNNQFLHSVHYYSGVHYEAKGINVVIKNLDEQHVFRVPHDRSKPLPVSLEVLKLENQKYLFLNQGFYTFQIGDSVALPAFNKSLLNTRISNSGASYKNGSDLLFGIHDTGFVQVIQAEGKLTPFVSQKYNSVSSFYQDKEQGLWISTLDNGVYYSKNPKIKRIENTRQPFVALTTDKSFIYAISADGTICKISEQRIPLVETLTSIKAKPYDLTFEFNRLIVSSGYFERDQNHRVDSNCTPHLVKLYTTGGKFSQNNTSNRLFHGGSRGIGYLNGDSLNYQVFRKAIIGTKRNHVAMINENEILVTTNNGLEMIDLKTNQKNKPKTLIENMQLKYIYPVSDDKYILTSAGQGILLYDLKREKIISRLTTADGLVSNSCTKIAEAAGNKFWICSDKGLNIVLLKNSNLELSSVLSKVEGIGAGEVKDVEFLGQRAFIVGINGIVYLDTGIVYTNTIPPPIYINSVSLEGEEQRKVLRSEQLNSAENDITFSYTGITYKQQGSVIYSYRLIGNSDYYLETSENKISFLNLNHGDYTFEIFAINHSGIKSSKPATFNFTILPPFYETWWFYSLVVLLILAVVYSFYRSQINRLKTKNENEIAFNELRQKALIAQMNPHFIFNSMNSILSLIMENKNAVAEDYLTQFSGLLRNALNQSDEAYTLIDDEIKITQEYIRLEELRFNYSICSKIEIEENIDISNTLMPSLLLQTLAENAILHGIIPSQKDGKITISFIKKTKKLLRITILDNGIGLKASKKLKALKPKTHKSKGTNILKARVQTLAQIHNLDCTIEFKDTGSGTSVIIMVPFTLNNV